MFWNENDRYCNLILFSVWKGKGIFYQKFWWTVVHKIGVIMQGIVCKQQPTTERKRTLVPQKLNVIIDGGVFLIKVPCVNCWLIIWCLLDIITKVKQFFTCQGFFIVVLILKNNTQSRTLVGALLLYRPIGIGGRWPHRLWDHHKRVHIKFKGVQCIFFSFVVFSRITQLSNNMNRMMEAVGSIF